MNQRCRACCAITARSAILAILLALLPPAPDATAGREKSNLDAKLTFINLVANRIFWSMWAGLPYCGDVTEPQCWNSKDFRSSIEKDSNGRYRQSSRLFSNSGYDPIANRNGAAAVWVPNCRPVSFESTIYDDIQKGFFIMRWPAFVDSQAFTKALLGVLAGSELSVFPYRIDENRAKEIYASRAKDRRATESMTSVGYWTWTYPILEIYFDRKIPAMLKIAEWLDPASASLDVPEAGWNQIKIQLRH